jgi:hypothetical protein
MTSETVQQQIRAFRFVLSSETITTPESQSCLKPPKTLIIRAAECEHSLIGMNGVFTPTRNLLLFKTVYRLIFQKDNEFLSRHFRL